METRIRIVDFLRLNFNQMIAEKLSIIKYDYSDNRSVAPEDYMNVDRIEFPENFVPGNTYTIVDGNLSVSTSQTDACFIIEMINWR